MYGMLFNVNDSVSCVYFGYRFYLLFGVDFLMYLFMNGFLNGINVEYMYLRSKGVDEDNGNFYLDMYYLFFVRAVVNIGRSNFFFGEIDDDEMMFWYYFDQIQSNILLLDVDVCSERVNGMFELREFYKGNVACVVFYFYIMYEEDVFEVDFGFFEFQWEMFCEWYGKDFVDLQEWERIFVIVDYQDGKLNFFVLDCMLVYCFYCQGFINDCDILMFVQEEVQIQVQVYLNFFIDWFYVVVQGLYILQVVDMLGWVYLR